MSVVRPNCNRVDQKVLGMSLVRQDNTAMVVGAALGVALQCAMRVDRLLQSQSNELLQRSKVSNAS